MHRPEALQLIPLTHRRSLKTLVENRTAFTLNHCELNIFETHQSADLVSLTFHDLVVTSMVRGKKVMHLFDKPGFDYLPGETVLVPAHVTMEIDFPEATSHNPTQCIALALDGQKIQKVLDDFNEHYPLEGHGIAWQLNLTDFHLQNDRTLAQNLDHLVNICSTDKLGKDMLADLALRELIIRIIQTQNHNQAVRESRKHSNQNPLLFAVHYIRENVSEKIQIDSLSDKACMSRATFYRAFKRAFGLNPLEFILRERIKLAKGLLANPTKTITEVCYQAGFSDLNYFDRQFKKLEGITPGQYRQVAQAPRIIQ